MKWLKWFLVVWSVLFGLLGWLLFITHMGWIYPAFLRTNLDSCDEAQFYPHTFKNLQSIAEGREVPILFTKEQNALLIERLPQSRRVKADMDVIYANNNVSVIFFNCFNSGEKKEFLVFGNHFVVRSGGFFTLSGLMQEAQWQVHSEDEEGHEVLFPMFVYELPYELQSFFEKFDPLRRKK